MGNERNRTNNWPSVAVQAGLSGNWKQKWNAIAAHILPLIDPEQVCEERKSREFFFESSSSGAAVIVIVFFCLFCKDVPSSVCLSVFVCSPAQISACRLRKAASRVLVFCAQTPLLALQVSVRL